MAESIRKSPPGRVTTVHSEGELIGLTVWDAHEESTSAAFVHIDDVASVAKTMLREAKVVLPGDLEWARRARALLLRAHEFALDAIDNGLDLDKATVATSSSLRERTFPSSSRPKESFSVERACLQELSEMKITLKMLGA